MIDSPWDGSRRRGRAMRKRHGQAPSVGSTPPRLVDADVSRAGRSPSLRSASGRCGRPCFRSCPRSSGFWPFGSTSLTMPTCSPPNTIRSPGWGMTPGPFGIARPLLCAQDQISQTEPRPSPLSRAGAGLARGPRGEVGAPRRAGHRAGGRAAVFGDRRGFVRAGRLLGLADLAFCAIATMRAPGARAERAGHAAARGERAGIRGERARHRGAGVAGRGGPARRRPVRARGVRSEAAAARRARTGGAGCA